VCSCSQEAKTVLLVRPICHQPEDLARAELTLSSRSSN
jgi:hypothetical protein